MLELIALTAIVYLILTRKERRRKRAKKFRTIDAEYKDLLESSADTTATAMQIRQLILDIIADTNNDGEKYADARLAQAQAIIDRAGPNAVYWLADIAAQLAYLSAAHINGFTSNIAEELGNSATAESIITRVAKI